MAILPETPAVMKNLIALILLTAVLTGCADKKETSVLTADDREKLTTLKEVLWPKEKNKPSYQSFRYEIKRLDIFENGTAIVAGTGHIEGEDENGHYKMIYQSSNVLIKRQGEWKAIASHVSGVKAVNEGE